MLSQAITYRCRNLSQQQNSLQLVLDQPCVYGDFAIQFRILSAFILFNTAEYWVLTASACLPLLHGRTKEFTMEVVYRGKSRTFPKGAKRGDLGKWNPAFGSGEFGGQSPLEAWANCEISVQFLTFSSKKLRLNEYFSETHNSKNSEDSLSPISPSGYASALL